MIVPLLKVKMNIVNNHHLLIWNYVMERHRIYQNTSWVFRSKQELLTFAIWKRKSNTTVSFGALHGSAMCTFISRQRKTASGNGIPHSSIKNRCNVAMYVPWCGNDCLVSFCFCLLFLLRCFTATMYGFSRTNYLADFT